MAAVSSASLAKLTDDRRFGLGSDKILLSAAVIAQPET
jgi:hypothetical protein